MPSAQRHRIHRSFIALVFVLAPSVAAASLGDCGQPVSEGTAPTATDALFILGAATGARTCGFACACDTDANAATTASDALRALKAAVAQTPIAGCDCVRPPCSSGVLHTLPGSRLDIGWNGLGGDLDFLAGSALPFRIVGRCADAPETVCQDDADCATGTCSPTCDCDDANDATCEIFEVKSPPLCAGSAEPCQGGTSCPVGRGPCVRAFGPPRPLSVATTPFCTFPFLSGDVTGTFDLASGESAIALPMLWIPTLGIANNQPCPRCGPPEQNPKVGDHFICEGGPNDGKPCIVELVTPPYGGTSSTCKEQLIRDIGYGFLANSVFDLTSGTTSRTASIPCIAPGVCTDDGGACSTNADCRRCTGLAAIPCTTNADCEAGAACAEAPQQAVSCGFYCHCGFCEHGELAIDEPAEPCFDDAECGEARACTEGDNRTGRQEQPNACADLICGRLDDERCCAEADPRCPTLTPLAGKCSEKEYIVCGQQSDCEVEAGGDCVLEQRRCFENTLTRAGVPSPAGGHCVEDLDVSACGLDSDCAAGPCVVDTMTPTLVALFCSTKTPSGAINAAPGLPGPGTLNVKSLVRFCRCGDGAIGCAEECDDGNQDSGDGCDQECRAEE